jgi:hypothetical protein
MRHLRESLLLSALFVIGMSPTYSQEPAKPKNLGLEEGELGGVPSDWLFPEPCEKAGYKLALSEERPFAGMRRLEPERGHRRGIRQRDADA